MENKEIKNWITMNGNRVPIFKGQSKKEAIKEFISSHNNSKIDKHKKLTTKELKDILKIDYGKFVKSGETTVVIPELKGDAYKGSDKYPITISHYEKDKSKKEQFNEILDVEEFYGKEYKGYKGQDAIKKLRQEQQGHVKNAFYRTDIGFIDLVWGNDGCGLKHSIQQRQKDNINIDDFLSNLTEVIEKGINCGINSRGRTEIWFKGKRAVIAPCYHGHKMIYMFTAFKNTKNKPPK